MPIFVKPTGPGEWSYGGAAAYDGVLHGKIDKEGLVFRSEGDGQVFSIRVMPPIRGGSDVECNRVLGLEGPPKPPNARKRPGEPVALLDFPIGS